MRNREVAEEKLRVLALEGPIARGRYYGSCDMSSRLINPNSAGGAVRLRVGAGKGRGFGRPRGWADPTLKHKREFFRIGESDGVNRSRPARPSGYPEAGVPLAPIGQTLHITEDGSSASADFRPPTNASS